MATDYAAIRRDRAVELLSEAKESDLANITALHLAQGVHLLHMLKAVIDRHQFEVNRIYKLEDTSENYTAAAVHELVIQAARELMGQIQTNGQGMGL